MKHNMRTSKGFTLIELLLVMMITSILVGPYIYQKTVELKEERVRITLSEISDIATSAQNYAAEQNLKWPDEDNQCNSAITLMRNDGYLGSLSDTSIYDTSYSTSCSNSAGNRFVVEVVTQTAEQAEILASHLPSSEASGKSINFSVPLPSSIPALEHLLPRDGSRPMTGDLDLGDNNIVNINDVFASGNVEAETVLLNKAVMKGEACSEIGRIATSSTGSVLSCTNGIWSGAEGSPEGMVSFFNLAKCPDGWLESNGENNTVDVRGEFIRGWDNKRGIDSGRERNSFQDGTEIGKWVYQAAYNQYTNSDSIRYGSNISRAGEAGYVSRQEFFKVRPRNVAMLACEKRP